MRPTMVFPRMTKVAKLVFLLICLTVSFSWAEEKKVIKPSSKDKCPVCGMFVAKYSDFLAAIAFKDGACVFFDGSKDMFKYYFNMKKYDPARKQGDIEAVYVTDYYDLKLVNGLEAFYVTGSDVHGPMGRELIPFAREEGAKEFAKDHKGKPAVKFREVTPALVKTLD
jgi:copper chaperone NosL